MPPPHCEHTQSHHNFQVNSQCTTVITTQYAFVNFLSVTNIRMHLHTTLSVGKPSFPASRLLEWCIFIIIFYTVQFIFKHVSAVSTVSRLWHGQLRSHGSNPEFTATHPTVFYNIKEAQNWPNPHKGKKFFISPNIQTSSNDTLPTAEQFSDCAVKIISHHHPRLRMHGVIPPLPHVPSCCTPGQV